VDAERSDDEEVSDSFVEVFSLSLACDPRAPREVREALDNVDGIASVRADAKLVATEMVSNAVLHSGGTNEHRIEVRGRTSAELLEISVKDPGLSERTPRVRENRQETDIGGLGLQIVEQLSHRWGVQESGGHLVWAQLVI
jgi:anti-sigma regulatory factor (Ser/Thr protein kinase)